MRWKNTLDAKVGLKLRDARLDKRWTQERLAICCGLSRETISLIENGKPWLAAIKHIEKALGIQVIPKTKNGARRK